MILWTIKPASLYEQILRDGYYHFDENKAGDAFNEDFQAAYDWLAEEMIKRIGKSPEGVHYPVWAWYIHDSKRKKPDLRKAEYGRKGEAMVCMEIEIPDDEVVLSDEEAWHFVLNKWYMSNASCEEEYDKEEVWLDGLNEDEKRKAIVDSWQHIFDITPFNNDFKIKGRYVQATFWELRADQIRKAVFFKGR